LLTLTAMSTARATPHFLRVTQALAFVSGLGIPITGCGGTIEVSGNDASGNCDAADCSEAALPGVAPGKDMVDAGIQSLDVEVSDVTMGISAPDAVADVASDAPVMTFDGGPLDPPDFPA
jgi:hypothetical protein